MTNTTTLRERLANIVCICLTGEGILPNDNHLPLYQDVAKHTAETLLAEIEARCAARGYTDLVRWWDDDDVDADDEEGPVSQENIVDFIAELRGEVQGEQ